MLILTVLNFQYSFMKHNYRYLDLEKKNFNNFCPVPWISLHAWADGNMFPCCKSDPMSSFGKLDVKKSYKENINIDSFIKLRQAFLNNERPDTCWKCFEAEDKGLQSMRQDQCGYYITELDDDYFKQTNINKPKIYYLDIRFSNKCNLACVMCSPSFSSKIYDIYKDLGMYVEGSKNKSIDYINKLKPYINDIKSVYLAGGEPFLDDNVLTLLDLLESNKKVSITFTTNCTIDLSNKKIAQKLEKLSQHNVNFNISLDGLPEYNDNIRLGGSFKKVCKNIEYLIENFPTFELVITPTLGILNIENFPNFYNYMQKYQCRWDLNFIQYPTYFDAINLPSERKLKLLQKTDNDQIKKHLSGQGDDKLYHEGLEFYEKYYESFNTRM